MREEFDLVGKKTKSRANFAKFPVSSGNSSSISKMLQRLHFGTILKSPRNSQQYSESFNCE